MSEKSRIKFNPQSREVEIEGSEEFVRSYFEKIRRMLVEPAAFPVNRGTAEKNPRNSKTVAGAAKFLRMGKRGAILNTVLSLIRDSEDGITTTQLKEKTGLSERQIWTVIYKAERAGRIRREKRGLYVAA